MPRTDVVTVRGVDLAIQEEGTGVPFVWGHGLTSSRAHEDEIGLMNLALPADRFRTIRYDARGHGASEGSRDADDYRYDQLAMDQIALLDALDLDRAIIGGASMGSVTALHTATVAPERVIALILAIPPTAWEQRAGRGELYAAGAAVIDQDGIEPFIELAAAEPPPAIFADMAGDLLEATANRYRALDQTVLPSIFRGIGGSDLPDRSAIEAIEVPTLVLAWEGDPVHPRATAEALDRLLPNSELHIAASLTQVMAWPDLARRFLRDVAPS